MFAQGAFFVPGQELREFTVLRPGKRETENGRIVNNSDTPIGTIKAILAQAKPEEKERWRQLQHPITHKIIMPFAADKPEINAEYVFELDGRRFYMKGEPYNIGDLNRWTIYYCEERNDTNVSKSK